LAVFQEIGWIENIDPTSGMSFVGIGFIILTIIVNLIAYRNRRKKDVVKASIYE